MRLSILLLSISAGGFAQTNLGPVLSGYIFRPESRCLQAIQGIPGSAILSRALVSELDAAWPSPAGSAAIGLRDGNTLLIRELDKPEPRISIIPGLVISQSLVAWSSNGSLAALVSNTGSVQTIRIQDGRTQTFDPGFLGDVAAVAVSDSGDVAIAVTNNGVFTLTDNGPAQVSQNPDIRKLRYGRAPFLVYGATVTDLAEIDTNSGTERVLFSGDHIAGFAVTPKGLYIADAGKLSVASISTNGELTATMSLERSPEMMETLTLDSLFLLNLPHDHQPAIVLPYDSQVVLFVPNTEAGTL